MLNDFRFVSAQRLAIRSGPKARALVVGRLGFDQTLRVPERESDFTMGAMREHRHRGAAGAAHRAAARLGPARPPLGLFWACCWRHWVDHAHGAWFRLLARDNVDTTDQKSPAGKVDYHRTGACCGILATLER